jgi:parallel beta-helix repeat protein
MIKNIFLVALSVLLSFTAYASELTVKSGSSIQAVINQAKDGDTILVEPGYYHESIYIDKQNITLKGLTKDGQYAHMDGQSKLNDGIIASGHGIIIDGFKVTGYKGNAIMTQGANNFKIINNLVHAAFYGIFPQFGKNGLIKGNTISGADDAAIYVGMCDHINVIGNTTFENVMGLEFENTRHGLMADNLVYNNSTGIMLSLIPGLPVKDSNNLVIRNNIIRNNNLANFAPASSIAATVPPGVGLIIEAVDSVIVKDNLFENNKTVGMFVTDMYSFGLGGDSKVEPYSDNIQVHKNNWVNNGNEPFGSLGDLVAMTGQTGWELLTTGKERDSCVTEQADFSHIGTQKWKPCNDQVTHPDYQTAMLANPIKSVKYTAEQKGRLTYLAVCTGCHTYNTVLHGPSMQAIKAMYSDNLAGLKSYIEKPIRKRQDFTEMPPQAYLGKETIDAIAKYVLNDLK